MLCLLLSLGGGILPVMNAIPVLSKHQITFHVESRLAMATRPPPAISRVIMLCSLGCSSCRKRTGINGQGLGRDMAKVELELREDRPSRQLAPGDRVPGLELTGPTAPAHCCLWFLYTFFLPFSLPFFYLTSVLKSVSLARM